MSQMLKRQLERAISRDDDPWQDVDEQPAKPLTDGLVAYLGLDVSPKAYDPLSPPPLRVCPLDYGLKSHWGARQERMRNPWAPGPVVLQWQPTLKAK